MSPFRSRETAALLKKVFLLLGLTLLVYVIIRIHPAEIARHLRTVGFGFLYLLGISFLWHLSYTRAWAISLKCLVADIDFWQIFRIKLAGETINQMNPLGWGASDPAKVWMLKRHIPLAAGAASVVVDRALNNLSVAFCTVVGVLLVLSKFSLPANYRMGLIVMLVLVTAFSIFFYLHSHLGFMAFFISLLRTLRIKKNFSEKTLTHAREIDEGISRFYNQNRGAFLLALGLHFFGKLCTTLEIFLASRLLDYPLSLTDSFLLFAMTQILNIVFVFIPGNLGVTEGAFAGTFALLGWDPAVGTSLQILRRIRMLCWTTLGFVFLASMREKTRLATNP